MKNAADWAAEDVKSFVESFNASRVFADTQTGGSAIKSLTSGIADGVYKNIQSLNGLGVTASEDGTLSFDRTKIDGASYAELADALRGAKSLASDIYGKSAAFIDTPLADHMNFKQLSYYYSYKLGSVTANPYQLVESGMIYDVAV